jgi:chorismate dehydratase
VNKIKISAVNYTNSIPFIYGIQNSAILQKVDLSLDIPSDCAGKLIDGQVDIGLIPVAAVLGLSYWEIVSDYCIGAVGAVNSVFIFSNCPIEDVEFLQLDPQSRSSNNLARVLLKNYWKLNPDFISNSGNYGLSTDPTTAFVQIGDRTFGKAHHYQYAYDLAEVWQNFTGLPFVFAAWIANKPIPPDFITEFNAALQLGLNQRELLIENETEKWDNFDLRDYLMQKVDYPLTETKKEAMNLFLKYLKEL